MTSSWPRAWTVLEREGDGWSVGVAVKEAVAVTLITGEGVKVGVQVLVVV